MSGPDISIEVMDAVRGAGLDDHLTILLGAGASAESGLPDWDELARRLLVRSGTVNDPDVATLLVARQDPLLAAQAARVTSGQRWNRVLRTALYDGITEATPSTLHAAVASYALSGAMDQTTLATLNFDTLLERAIGDGGSRAKPSVDGIADAKTYVVHHLHGVVSHRPATSPAGVVVTLSDFNDLIGDRDAWQERLVRDAVQSGALLIAGTSYRDPDVRMWVADALRNQPDGHAAVVLLARQGFALPRDDFGKLRAALEVQWHAIGMKPVVVEDFSDAAQIIRELRFVHDTNYRSPQQRSRSVWDAHVARFDRLQHDYYDVLSHDAAAFREVFDCDQLNVTMWLANAEGNIARWAAQDRLHHALEDVRLVESGHDSRWFAGRALARETLLFHDVPAATASRWRSVLAIPLRVEIAGLPSLTAGVLSIGLPLPASRYLASALAWSEVVKTAAEAWSNRLVEILP